MTLDVAGLGLVGSESVFSDSVWKNLKRAKMSLLLSAFAMIFGILIFALDLGIYLFTLVLPVMMQLTN